MKSFSLSLSLGKPDDSITRSLLFLTGVMLLAPVLVVRCVANDPAATDVDPSSNRRSETITIRGIVLGPDEQPVEGARLYINVSERTDTIELATSKVDGRFHIDVPAATLRRDVTPTHSLLKCKASLMAVAEGYGSAWAFLPSQDGGRFGRMKSEYVVPLKLVEDLPVTGRIVDEAGNAVVGANVTVDSIHELRGRNWHKMPAAVESLDTESMTRTEIDVSGWFSHQYPDAWTMLSSAATDDAGFYTLTQLGSNRAVELNVSGPGIRPSRKFSVLVREDASEFARLVREKYPDIESPKIKRGVRLFGLHPNVVVQRARTVAGVVRDATTLEPVENATISVMGTRGRVKTDRHGRYRLTRTEDRSAVTLVVDGDQQLYIPTVRTVANAGGISEVTVDFQLPRGIVLHGKVVETATNMPIASEHRHGCHDSGLGPLIAGYATYYPLAANEWVEMLRGRLPDYPFFSNGRNHLRTTVIDENGEFQMAVPQGPGVVLIDARPPLPMFSNGTHRVPYRSIGDRAEATASASTNPELTGIHGPILFDRFHAWKLLNPVTAATRLDVRFEVPPPPSRTIRFVDSSGNPTTGVRVAGLVPQNDRGGLREFLIEGSEADAYAIPDNGRRRITAITADGRFGGGADIAGSDESPITLTLQPTGSIRFRLVDRKTGKPLVGYSAWLRYRTTETNHSLLRNASDKRPETNARGEVEIPAVIPRALASMFLIPPVRKDAATSFRDRRAPEVEPPSELEDIELNVGEQRDLGEIRVELVAKQK